MLKTICLYCGSSHGSTPLYREASVAMARHLASEGIGIVYGGAAIGIMGAIADAALEVGGEVIGVIPEGLQELEIAHTGLTSLEVVNDMHQRKARMAELADGFIALPGGFGTLEELFEMLTWSQLRFHTKPCAVLNAGGFYSGLLSFLDSQVEAGFVKPIHRELLLSESDPTALLALLQAWRPAAAAKITKESLKRENQ